MIPINSAILSPHGMQIIPGLENPYSDKFRSLRDAMLKTKENLEKLNPNLLILISPHGLTLDKDFGIYLNQRFRGYLPKLTDSNIDGREIIKTLEFKGNIDFSNELYQFLKQCKIPISGIYEGTEDFPGPIAWGELVLLNYFGTIITEPKVVIISIPRSRYNIHAIKSQLLNLGENIAEFCQNRPESISLILSGDLSHCHLETGPYGFSPKAELFDNIITRWIQTFNRTLLLQEAYDLSSEALSCGLTTLTIFQGVIDFYQKIKYKNWKGKLIEYGHPTYFGMAVAEMLVFNN
ncbi:MAG: hypothetical protein ACTSVU_06305 [Promethearchaeota archaeon]